MKPLAIARVNWRRLGRDRVALFFMLLLPVVIILIIGVALGGFEGSIPVGVLDLDGAPLARDLRMELARNGVVEARTYTRLDAMRKAVRREQVLAGVVIPKGFDASLRAGRQAEVGFVLDQTQEPPIATRAAVASVVAARGKLVQAAQFSMRNSGGTFDDNLRRATEVERGSIPVTTEVRELEPLFVRVPLGFGYTAPSNLVLFVFIGQLAGAGVLVETRRLGVWGRMLGTPTPARSIVAGETLSRLGIALFQGLFIVAVGALVFGVRWGIPPE